ncbi:signal peptidase I, partial [Chlamydia psittaci C1/97]
MLKIP